MPIPVPVPMPVPVLNGIEEVSADGPAVPVPGRVLESEVVLGNRHEELELKDKGPPVEPGPPVVNGPAVDKGPAGVEVAIQLQALKIRKGSHSAGTKVGVGIAKPMV